MEKKIKIAELFCGAGGFAEGAKQAGFKHLWGVDNHEDSCKSFKNNQKCEAFFEDIKNFSKESNLKNIKKNYGNINGLLFGFPCNDFSLVGKNKNSKVSLEDYTSMHAMYLIFLNLSSLLQKTLLRWGRN